MGTLVGTERPFREEQFVKDTNNPADEFAELLNSVQQQHAKHHSIIGNESAFKINSLKSSFAKNSSLSTSTVQGSPTISALSFSCSVSNKNGLAPVISLCTSEEELNKGKAGEFTLSDLYYSKPCDETNVKSVSDILSHKSTDSEQKSTEPEYLNPLEELLSKVGEDYSESDNFLNSYNCESNQGILDLFPDLSINGVSADESEPEVSSNITKPSVHSSCEENIGDSLSFSLADLYFANTVKSAYHEESEENNLGLDLACGFLETTESSADTFSDDDDDLPADGNLTEDESISCDVIDLSSTRKQVLNVNKGFESTILKSNRYSFKRTPLVKTKPSLLCKVLCAKPRMSENIRETDRTSTSRLHNMLEELGYFKFFSFDSPSPDDVVKQKQKFCNI